MKPRVSIKAAKDLPLRDAWESEPKFSDWLSKNMEFLSDILGFELNVISREESVGPFNVDIFAEDLDGNKVIIENQLEKTDHDHLGKVLTYFTNIQDLGAKVAIWIVKEAEPEHARAIEWLNEVTPEDVLFYLIRVKLIQVEDESSAAPLFNVIVEPTEGSKKIGEEKKELAQRHILRKKFWTQLLEKAKEKTDLHSSVSPSTANWLGTGAGKSGVSYEYVANYENARCEVYLNNSFEEGEENINKLWFDKLKKHKEEIERVFGNKLTWYRNDEGKTSKIYYKINFGIEDEDRWEELQEKLIENMIKLEKAFRPHIRQLD